MKVSKKKKKGNRLAKLKNGGLSREYDNGGGIPTEPKNTEELLARLNDFGLDNPNEIKGLSDEELARMYEDLPASGAISSGPPIDLAIALGLAPGALALKGAQAIGEFGYSALAPWASTVFKTPIAGVPALTLENALISEMAMNGLTNVAPNIKEFVQDPSWSGAGKVALNLFEILPLALTEITNLARAKNSIGGSTIKLSDATTDTSIALEEMELTSRFRSHVNASVDLHATDLKKGLVTKEQFETQVARNILYQQQMMKQEGYTEHLLKATKRSFGEDTNMTYWDEGQQMYLSTQQALEQKLINRNGSKSVKRFGYASYDDPVDPNHATWTMYDDSQTAFKKLYELMTHPEADGVLKRAVAMTQKQLQEKASVTGPVKGLYKRANSVFWEDVYEGATINYLEDLTPGELIRNLAHEDHHARRVRFMDFLLDNWAVSEFTMVNDIRPGAYGDVQSGIITHGSELQNVGINIMRYPLGSKGYRDWEKKFTYLLDPNEVVARLGEIQRTWWDTPEGANMADWAYKWTPELAKKAYNNWDEMHPLISVMKGHTEKDKFVSLANLLNNTLAPAAAIIGVNQVTNNEAVADPDAGFRQYKKGGFIANKFRPSGMNLRKSN